MRRFLPPLALTLIVAGCAAPQQQRPAPPPTPAVPVPQPPQPQPPESGALIGMTAADLLAHFGTPALQVREGTSLKLQFRGLTCVLDAYLYPSPTGGAPRVTHVDARLKSGADTDATACTAQLNRGS